MAFGDMDPVLVKPTTLNINYVYIFMIKKSGQDLSLTVYPNISVTTAKASTFIDGAQIAVPPTQDVLLSNKELKINASGNLQAHIYNLAIWNKVISMTSTIDFYNSTKTELQKNDPTLASLSAYINDLKNQVQRQKSCPYDVATCAACTGITDWTNMSDVILNAGADCLAKINAYCIANPMDSKCTCWNTSSALSDTPGCKSYKAIFTKDLSCNIDHIDADTLDQIRKKYNMCAETKPVVPVPGVTPVIPIPVQQKTLQMLPAPAIPRMLNNIYTINSSDIDVYDNAKIAVTGTATGAAAGDASFSATVDGGVFGKLWNMVKPT